MRPLILDDVLPLEEYAGRRREFLESFGRYVDRYRRVRIGPLVTLLFENRQTLWFRVQEILRIARLTEPEQVQEELRLYNRLLPRPNHLQAALLIEIVDENRLVEELDPWRQLRGEDLQLRIGVLQVVAKLITCRPEDRAIGAAHWVQFNLDSVSRIALSDADTPAHFCIRCAGYQHESEPLSEEVRQSLLEDLEMADKE